MSAPTFDLRSGRTAWEIDATAPSLFLQPHGSFHAEVVIVGAGITGAFIADRLARAGRAVVVLDRHAPQQASTAASTALLQWEIDAPLIELEDRFGFEMAAAIYRRSVESVREIGALLGKDRALCGFDWRDTLFLAGDVLDAADLREEHRIRAHAGIHGDYLDSDSLFLRFAFKRDAALSFGGSAQANPMRLARLLLDRAIAHGAQVISPTLVTRYDCGAQGVTVGTTDGAEIGGQCLILANGYEMPPFVPAARHEIVSTWAVATAPQAPGALWFETPLVWEASEPYCYMRATPEGRIIIGGEDAPITDAAARDALIGAKAETLQQKLSALLPGANVALDAAWTGFFGATEDGLPIIGRVPGYPNCYAAFGYGGNGITFSAMAAGIIETLLDGGSDPATEWFAVDR